MKAGSERMDEQINIGVVGMGKMGILHTGILSSLDGVEVKAVADEEIRFCLLNVWKG